MDKQIFILILITCVISGLLCGCQGQSTAVPGQLAPPQVTQMEPEDTKKASSPDVLEACHVNQQALAMRPDQIPDWDHIGLFACYNLSLALIDPGEIFTASETLVMTNLGAAPLNDIVFRLYPNAKNIYGGKITVSDVSTNRESLRTEVFLVDHTALRVLLNHPLSQNETITLELIFSFELPITTASQEAYGIFGKSFPEPVFTMANWFPILAPRQDGKWLASVVLQGGDAVTSDSALFHVSITAPATWQLAATGKEIARAEISEGIRHEYVSGPVRDFMISASPNFLTKKQQIGDILVTQFGIESTFEKWEQALATARAAIIYYQKTYGPYPFNEIDIVAVPLQNASGVEYPGLILITNNAYQPGGRQGLLEVVIAHELAHQWWYSVIGNNVNENPWQDEGLTTYSTLEYFQSISSPTYLALLSDYHDRVNSYEIEHPGPGNSISQPVAAFQGRENAYSILVYAKTAIFFDKIRARIGQASLDTALKQYYLSNKFLLTQPEVLLNAIRLTCQCDLSDLFKEYGVSQFIP